jgi:phthalate 4,5-dioxygenase oxygenase subunit
MMTQEENAMLTGVNPGTPLHRPLSRFWYPVLRSEKLVDRCTHKVRLLGENFVVARRGNEVLAVDERCPHRQTSMLLARVEEGGLRCIYHGWLMGCDGTVKETPNERESGGRPNLRVRAPGVREAGGLIWLNTCDNESERAPFPDWTWLSLPASQVVVTDVAQKTNWVQSIEGAIDSSHTSILHQDNVLSAASTQASTVVSAKGAAVQVARPSADKHPRMRVRDTDSGFIYGALRKSLKDPDGLDYVRATAFAFPAYIAFTVSEELRAQLIFVPIDDISAHFYSIWYSMTEPMDRPARVAWSGLDPAHDLDADGYLKICSLPNWGQDRAAMAAGGSFTGLKGINVQDTIVQESMGPIVDRTKEHLGVADLGIVHFRRLMLAVARGEGPAATPEFAVGMNYGGLRARDGLVLSDRDWTSLYRDGEINWQPKALEPT